MPLPQIELPPRFIEIGGTHRKVVYTDYAFAGTNTIKNRSNTVAYALMTLAGSGWTGSGSWVTYTNTLYYDGGMWNSSRGLWDKTTTTRGYASDPSVATNQADASPPIRVVLEMPIAARLVSYTLTPGGGYTDPTKWIIWGGAGDSAAANTGSGALPTASYTQLGTQTTTWPTDTAQTFSLDPASEYRTYIFEFLRSNYSTPQHITVMEIKLMCEISKVPLKLSQLHKLGQAAASVGAASSLFHMSALQGKGGMPSSGPFSLGAVAGAFSQLG